VQKLFKIIRYAFYHQYIVKQNNRYTSVLYLLIVFQGLDINQAWDFMCNYLVYEFRGAEEGLQEFIGSETRTTVLLSDIWLFYRSERLFLLKCINVLLTFHSDKGHPYQVGFCLCHIQFHLYGDTAKHCNINVCKTIILPILYECETWLFFQSVEHK
jgi:hypothetical protein